MKNSSLSLDAAHIKKMVVILLCMYPLVGMCIDLIAPSLPAISHDLQVSSQVSKNLITVYLFGCSFGSFLIALISDGLGRRKLLLGSLLIFIFSSLIAPLSPNPLALLIVRFMQGMSTVGFSVVGRAIFADILPTQQLKRVATLCATMWGIGPIIGPVIGGYLQAYFNWQAGFYFFAIYAGTCFLLIYRLIPETHYPEHSVRVKRVIKNFSTILTHRVFWGVVTLMGVTYSALVIFNTLGSFLIQTVFDKSPVYFGHIALVMGSIFLIGTFICRYLVSVISYETLLKFSIRYFTIITLIGLCLAYEYPTSLWVVIVSSLFMFLACGIIYPAMMGMGLTLFQNLAGSSAAIMNLINLFISGLISTLAGFMNPQTFVWIAAFYFGLMLTCVVLYRCLIVGKR